MARTFDFKRRRRGFKSFKELPVVGGKQVKRRGSSVRDVGRGFRD